MEAQKVEQLQAFVAYCRSNPSALHHPSLSFFTDYLHSLGARIPPDPTPGHMKMESDSGTAAAEEDYVGEKFDRAAESAGDEDEIVESDLELDGGELVVPDDDDPPQKMGDPSVAVSDESRDAAQACKAKAIDAVSEGKLDEAVEHLSEAILLNPTSAILYATRASVFVKLKKPNAAIRDADEALQINPDSAKGYKSRGMAKAMLGRWEEAAKDLHLASKLDFDEEIDSVLKKVEPNVQKIEAHRRKYERLRKEREMKKAQLERQRRRAEAEAAYERAKKEQTARSKASDPEVNDPAAAAALQDGNVISIHSSSELETKFRAASNLSRLVILYFTATWCGPCRFMAPLYKSLAEKHPRIVFLKVDIDELGDVAHRWNVNSVPTFFFVKNGKEIDKVVGADKNGLERKIALHAGESENQVEEEPVEHAPGE
ncbi:TPR repeat-containing thioredoxin TDX isoform X2 [Ananas comosus]|uniref:TPR repeat-containing thioredoxin TDX n=1 Tax=Ananas comosus TaxID=4615 RepID=A0A6P5EI46_ANACO|nr:TPR repeat-containing thioredoxin TDX isoform X2 [Ananas comosus]